MPIFITNEAQIILTYHIQKGHKLIPEALKWIFWRYLTSNAPPRLILLHIKTVLTISALFSKLLFFRIPETQRAQTGLIFNSWDKFLRKLVCEIQHFSAIQRTVCHPSRLITSWTSFLQRCNLGNSVAVRHLSSSLEYEILLKNPTNCNLVH
jgi:hypothetical protein